MQLINEGFWLEALKVAERSGGVTLSEVSRPGLQVPAMSRLRVALRCSISCTKTGVR